MQAMMLLTNCEMQFRCVLSSIIHDEIDAIWFSNIPKWFA